MDEDSLKGMQVAAETRTVKELVQLLIDVGMLEDEIVATLTLITQQAVRDISLKSAH